MIRSTDFTFDKATQTMSVEASDLGNAFQLVRVYSDSADKGRNPNQIVTGIRIYSVHSRKIVEAYLEVRHRDNDGDVTHWTFKFTAGSIQRLPALAGVTVVIFHD